MEDFRYNTRRRWNAPINKEKQSFKKKNDVALKYCVLLRFLPIAI